MTHFSADMVQRSHDEIDEMCKEMRDSINKGGKQFEDLSYEDGVIATVRWIFFKSSRHPCDGKERGLDQVVQKTILQVNLDNHAQAREGSDV